MCRRAARGSAPTRASRRPPEARPSAARATSRRPRAPPGARRRGCRRARSRRRGSAAPGPRLWSARRPATRADSSTRSSGTAAYRALPPNAAASRRALAARPRAPRQSALPRARSTRSAASPAPPVMTTVIAPARYPITVVITSMAEPNAKTRERLVAGAADMIRRRGLSATSVRELAKHSGAPLGSTYHYFPGGKQQLATEAVEFAGDTIARTLDRALERGPLEGLRAFLATWRKTITSADFRAGCPVLARSEEHTSELQSRQYLVCRLL